MKWQPVELHSRESSGGMEYLMLSNLVFAWEQIARTFFGTSYKRWRIFHDHIPVRTKRHMRQKWRKRYEGRQSRIQEGNRHLKLQILMSTQQQYWPTDLPSLLHHSTQHWNCFALTLHCLISNCAVMHPRGHIGWPRRDGWDRNYGSRSSHETREFSHQHTSSTLTTYPLSSHQRQ